MLTKGDKLTVGYLTRKKDLHFPPDECCCLHLVMCVVFCLAQPVML